MICIHFAMSGRCILLFEIGEAFLDFYIFVGFPGRQRGSHLWHQNPHTDPPLAGLHFNVFAYSLFGLFVFWDA